MNRKRNHGHLSRYVAVVSGTALVLALAAAGEMFRRRAVRERERRRRLQTPGQLIAVGNGNSGRARRGRALRSLHREGQVSQTLNEPVVAISAQGM